MTQISERPPISVVSAWWGLIRCFPGLYSLTTAMRIFVFVGIFQATGLIIRFYFDSLSGPAPLAWGPNAWAAVMLAVALLRNGLIFADMYVFFRWTFSTAATMRKNLLEHILSIPAGWSRCWSAARKCAACERAAPRTRMNKSYAAPRSRAI